MNRIALPLIVSAVLLATSCTKEVTRVEKQYFYDTVYVENPVYFNDGFIYGKITGLSREEVVLDDIFEYTQLFDFSNDSWCIIFDNRTEYFIARYHIETGGYLILHFIKYNDGSYTIYTPAIKYVVWIADNEMLNYAPAEDDIIQTNIYNVAFDNSTSVVTGKYNITVEMGGNVSVVSGDFDAYVPNTWYKKGVLKNRSN